MKGGFDFDYYLTVDHLGSGRPAEAVKRALLRVYYTVYTTLAPMEVIGPAVSESSEVQTLQRT
jgi:hypothetical protein